MRVALITRSTLFAVKGGDTVQVVQTARHLTEIGITADIRLANEKIDYKQYDLLHLFNLTRPADLLNHLRQSNTPSVLTPIFVDYSEYDRCQRNGLTGAAFKLFSASTVEFLKTTARWLKGSDRLISKSYLWKGQRKSMQEVLHRVNMVLPNSEKEWDYIQTVFKSTKPHKKIPNGIDAGLFQQSGNTSKDAQLIICVARVEGIKNQLNLIKAVNHTGYRLFIIGAASQNQKNYLEHCKKIAGPNIYFLDHIPQEELIRYYDMAKVHVLPSWFETCGLSSLEAAGMGCQVVITDKGFAREYFGDLAYYCDPGSPVSIRQAIDLAMAASSSNGLKEKVRLHYNWQETAALTAKAYQTIVV